MEQFISVDDHVVEPPDLWTHNLPGKWRDIGPHVARLRGRVLAGHGRRHQFIEDEEGSWGDVWEYADLRWPLTPSYAAVSFSKDDLAHRPIMYEDIRLGCYNRNARIEDLNTNHTEASICFPSFPRFCGQTFLERGDRDVSEACVRAYNDWMIDEWCGDTGQGRLIPLTLIPLWDVELAAAEIRRCAAKGSHAMAFSENPVSLGLPSIHTEYWDPLWKACQDTDTVVNMHIGSSSTMATTGPESPQLVNIALTFQGALHATVDILLSGIFTRFPALRIALSEGQVGWMPFILERLDNAWAHARSYGGVGDKVPQPPSSYVVGHLYGCIFDDLVALRERGTVGMSQIMFETDYPHGDSTFPESMKVAEKIVAEAELSEHEAWQLLRGNAIECYGLERFGIER